VEQQKKQANSPAAFATCLIAMLWIAMTAMSVPLTAVIRILAASTPITPTHVMTAMPVQRPMPAMQENV
jgi:ABC-type Na+ efflux pump permease subunit